MKLDSNKVNTLEDLLKFIEALRIDFDTNNTEWANVTISQYLESVEAGIRDHARLEDSKSDPNDQVKLAESNPYQAIAKALEIGKVYE